MEKIWSDEAWDDYIYWQRQDKRTLLKINSLIKNIERSGTKGKGKKEQLRYRRGFSKRIDESNRLVFDIEDDRIYIVSCSGHYE